jgi:mycofactocin precursor peptide MftA
MRAHGEEGQPRRSSGFRGRCCRVALGVTNVRDTPSPLPEVRMPETPQTDAAVVEAPAPAEDLVEEESLVEEVSIDGMCGVY